MNKTVTISILIATCILMIESCNYKMIVKKDHVLFDEIGYLVFSEQGEAFIQLSDSSYCYTKILNAANKNSFWVSDLSNQERLRLLSISRKIPITYTMSAFPEDLSYDSLGFVYVRMKAIPRTIGNANDDILYKNTSDNYMTIHYSDKNYKLPVNFATQRIYYIYPIIDAEKIKYRQNINNL